MYDKTLVIDELLDIEEVLLPEMFLSLRQPLFMHGQRRGEKKG